jgi:hypothetical protein
MGKIDRYYGFSTSGVIAQEIDKWARLWAKTIPYVNDVDRLEALLYEMYRRQIVLTRPYGTLEYKILEATLDEFCWTGLARKIIEER